MSTTKKKKIICHKPGLEDAGDGGIETARQIRKRIGSDITIILLSSFEFSEIEEEAKAAGVDAFIAKPLFRSRLTATLRRICFRKKRKDSKGLSGKRRLQRKTYFTGGR